MSRTDSPPTDLDVIVIGAGFSGLYALHRLRGSGLEVRLLEAADDVGGTWLWNSYPGARCDVESLEYSYSFSPELDQEWTWTERYAAQPEILSYIRHVADRFDLRRSIRFGTRVEGMTWAGDRWAVRTDKGENLCARFVVLATGSLSAPLGPIFPGADSFAGESYMTQTWPRTPVDFTGKRVAVIGTGSSGIQVVPVVAEQAAQLTVFQRTANFSIPGNNRALGPEEVDEFKAAYPEHRAAQARSHGGVVLDSTHLRADEMTTEQRRAELERRWAKGGALNFAAVFRDTMTDLAANQVIADFIREKIRDKVADPATAELLCPDDHPFGVKRPCVDHGYYEAFNRDNVTLVPIRHNPIAKITADGIALEDGTEYAADVIIYALGYDAVSGAIEHLDIRGRDDRLLREEWRDGPRSYLGTAFAGFPNLFSLSGPGSPSVLALPIATAEHQVNWIADTIAALADRGAETIEATRAAQDEWTELIGSLAGHTLYGQTSTSSWYLGANVPGKARAFLIYLGGLARFRAALDAAAAGNYQGFSVR